MVGLLQTRVALPDAETRIDLVAAPSTLRLCVTLQMVKGFIQFDWSDGGGTAVASGRVTCSGRDELRWELTVNGQTEKAESRHHLNSIRAQLQRWQLRFPVAHAQVSACWVSLVDNSSKPITKAEAPCGPGESPWNWIEDRIQGMAHGMRIEFSPVDRMLRDADPVTLAEARRYEERLERKEQRRAEEEQRRRETMERLAAERRQRELSAVEANKVANATKVAAKPHLKSGISNLKSGIAGRAPLPPVPR